MKRVSKRGLRQLPIYLLLLLFSAVAILPFLYMLATAMTPHTYTMPYPPILFPKSFYLKNFAEAWTSNSFNAYFLNSLFISSVATVAIIGISCMSAYGFARMKFPGRNVIFYLLLFSMMVPTLTNLGPQFLLMKHLHLVDTYTGLILMYIGMGVAGNTFFLRNFFIGLPKELEESVVIDGGNHWTIFAHIILPLSKPAIGTFTIMAFSNVWDEFLVALTMIKTPAKRTLPIALKLFQGQHVNDWSLIFAASLIAVVPILLVFIVLQKKLIRGGILEGTIKG